MWHHFLGDLAVKLYHLGLRGTYRGCEIDVFESGESFFEFLEMSGQLLGGASEPGAKFHEVLDCRYTCL